MKIACNGLFLKNGLEENGHTVFILNAAPGKSLQEMLGELPSPVDLVLWECYGASSAIASLGQCQAPVAGWCIDSPLNDFWFSDAAKLFDYVFVDQRQSIDYLAKSGISAHLLPLPAHKSYFRNLKTTKKYDLTFIGTVNEHRLKRKNLLKLLASRFRINVQSGLTIPQSQDIFAQSKIVLNENLFPGLTLRILQGLASGAIVFTESSPYGFDYGFKNFQDLVWFNNSNIIGNIEKVLDDYENSADMGRVGQAACLNRLATSHVANELIKVVAANPARRAPHDEFAWSKLRAEFLFTQRYGGNLGRFSTQLAKFANQDGPQREESLIMLASLMTFMGRRKEAQKIFLQCASPEGLVKLALFHLEQADLISAKDSINACMSLLEGYDPNFRLDSLADRSAIRLAVADIYCHMQKFWHMGFEKAYYDPLPDTAYDAARLAWSERPSWQALEVMEQCLSKFHMRGELLPDMLAGIKMGLAPDEGILSAARLAMEYYDQETAMALIKGIKQKKK